MQTSAPHPAAPVFVPLPPSLDRIHQPPSARCPGDIVLAHVRERLGIPDLQLSSVQVPAAAYASLRAATRSWAQATDQLAWLHYFLVEGETMPGLNRRVPPGHARVA